MVQFLIFVYSLVIFLSLFLGEAAIERFEVPMGMHFATILIFSNYFVHPIYQILVTFFSSLFDNVVTTNLILCVSDVDCPITVKPNYTKCVGGICWYSFKYEGPKLHNWNQRTSQYFSFYSLFKNKNYVYLVVQFNLMCIRCTLFSLTKFYFIGFS